MTAAFAKLTPQRVMPHSFFILSRLFVRVDAVVFRVFDVRVFHSFGSNEIIRESTGMEAPYEAVKSVSPLFRAAARMRMGR